MDTEIDDLFSDPRAMPQGHSEGDLGCSADLERCITEDEFAERWMKVDPSGLGLYSTLNWYELGEYAYASFQSFREFLRIIVLVVRSDVRGQGRGRGAMREILNRADEVGVTLKLEVAPVDSYADMDGQDLADWYMRLGFRPREPDAPDIMFREPGRRPPAS